MYVLIAGGGKVGSNLARIMIRGGHEVTLIEQRGSRFDALEAVIEHEVLEDGLIHLLELRKENLEIVEVTVGERAACAGKRIEKIELPEGSRLISVVRDGKAEIPDESTQLEPGDSVLAILEPGKEDELRRLLVRE